MRTLPCRNREFSSRICRAELSMRSADAARTPAAARWESVLMLTRHLRSARMRAFATCRATIGRPAEAGLGFEDYTSWLDEEDR